MGQRYGEGPNTMPTNSVPSSEHCFIHYYENILSLENLKQFHKYSEHSDQAAPFFFLSPVDGSNNIRNLLNIFMLEH